ncbi:MAG: HAMP domain-containing histidine kinase [Deltaproteobacteria bacterium]|nr:HAMP domain-containing histidine kinase [Deltaproteobacteria bacterium]
MVDRDLAIDVLVRFARFASDAEAATEIVESLAEALHEQAHAAGVAIVEIGPSGARVTATRHLSCDPSTIRLDPDAMGPELGNEILAKCGASFGEVETILMVAEGNLFGAAVLLSSKGTALSDVDRRLAAGLVDLAAITLSSALHVEKLEAAYIELRESQAMLARTEKLRALGQMAAGVSHDLKNILNPLSLHLQVAERALARGKLDDVKESIVEMKQVVVRGVETVERLRSYSRQSKESKTELVDVEKLLHEAAGIAKPRMASLGRVLRFVEDFHHPPMIMAVSGDLVSAIVNLVVNAIDAAGEVGKSITLRTGEIDGGVFVDVEDDGPGMPPDVKQKVFEPFFTTKGTEGTGLGLAMVYATVQRHGGTIALESEPGAGTRFRLWFPGGPPSVR